MHRVQHGLMRLIGYPPASSGAGGRSRRSHSLVGTFGDQAARWTPQNTQLNRCGPAIWRDALFAGLPCRWFVQVAYCWLHWSDLRLFMPFPLAKGKGIQVDCRILTVSSHKVCCLARRKSCRIFGPGAGDVLEVILAFSVSHVQIWRNFAHF